MGAGPGAGQAWRTLGRGEGHPELGHPVGGDAQPVTFQTPALAGPQRIGPGSVQVGPGRACVRVGGGVVVEGTPPCAARLGRGPGPRAVLSSCLPEGRSGARPALVLASVDRRLLCPLASQAPRPSARGPPCLLSPEAWGCGFRTLCPPQPRRPWLTPLNLGVQGASGGVGGTPPPGCWPACHAHLGAEPTPFSSGWCRGPRRCPPPGLRAAPLPGHGWAMRPRAP